MSLDATLRLFGGMDTFQYAKCMKTLVDFAAFETPDDARAKYIQLAKLPSRSASAAAQDELQAYDELDVALRKAHNNPLEAQPSEFPADDAMVAQGLADRELATATAASKAEAAI